MPYTTRRQREKRRANIINGMEKEKEKKGCLIVDQRRPKCIDNV